MRSYLLQFQQWAYDISKLKILESMLLDDNFSLQVAELWDQKDALWESTTTEVSNGLPKIFELFKCKSKKRFQQ